MFRNLALAGVLLLPAVAVAQPIQGLYIGGDVGANFAGAPQSSQATTKIYTDAGPVGIAALGWGFRCSPISARGWATPGSTWTTPAATV
jgi:hypothetical protein